MNALDFLNKNMYRKYPIRATCDMTFIDGTLLPQDVLTGMQISTIYGKHDLFISKVSATEGYISVVINDVTDGAALGCFAGKVLSDFSIIPFTSYVSYMSGSMTTGKKTSLTAILGTHFFRDEATDSGTRENSRLEASTVFCFTPPGITKIIHESNTLTGRVTTTVSSNMTQTIDGDILTLAAKDIGAILSNNEFSGDINSCPTPIIKKLNTVKPNVNGNIDIYGIVPLVIDVSTGLIGFDAPISLVDVCPEKNKISPPVNNSDAYYGDILTVDTPEWRTWERFDV
jgi:hypothetical protein